MSRIFAIAILMTTLTSCASGGGITPGQAFPMSIGQTVTLPDTATLRYVKVAADSRCPPKVQCIRAGDADVAFEFTAPGATDATAIMLNLPEAPSKPIGNWQLTLLDLEFNATPRATIRVDKPSP